jgi:thymidine kinase
MAKLYFYYSSMNAGKSTTLLQSSYNYRERGMNTLVLTPELDNRVEVGTVSSRIGLTAEATTFTTADNLLAIVEDSVADQPLHCLLIDEAQFLVREQVQQLGNIADDLGIPVLCYGLRTDFQGQLFEGSQHLLAWADNLVEIKTICHCGSKATMVLRLDGQGRVVKQGEQIKIGGNESYQAVCRKHFKLGMATRDHAELPFDDPPDPHHEHDQDQDQPA